MEQALAMDLTDGSIEGNAQFRKLMTGSTWDPEKKAFKNKSGIFWTPGSNLDDFLRG
jgi:hypothetical protein